MVFHLVVFPLLSLGVSLFFNRFGVLFFVVLIKHSIFTPFPFFFAVPPPPRHVVRPPPPPKFPPNQVPKNSFYTFMTKHFPFPFIFRHGMIAEKNPYPPAPVSSFFFRKVMGPPFDLCPFFFWLYRQQGCCVFFLFFLIGACGLGPHPVSSFKRTVNILVL